MGPGLCIKYHGMMQTYGRSPAILICQMIQMPRLANRRKGGAAYPYMEQCVSYGLDVA